MTARFVQWRAYVGPAYKGETEDGFWNWADEIVWTAGTAGNGLDPTDFPATTLVDELVPTSLGGTSIVCVDTSTLPTEGGVWVAPGASDEVWEYILYTTNDGTTLGGLTRDTSETEFSGYHQAGGEVRFLWPLDTVEGEPVIHEEMSSNLSLVSAGLTLEGVTAPQAALRIGHGLLLQARSTDVSTVSWSAWKNEFYGWITSVRIRDDVSKFRSWDIQVALIDAMAGIVHVDSVQVGNTNTIKNTTALASSTLAKSYKAHGENEFVSANPTISAGNVVDGNRETLWISERFIGKENTPANPGTSFDGMAGSAGAAISQVHVFSYPGQPGGYRWIEITFFGTTSTYNDFLIYSVSTTTGSLTGDPYVIDYYIDLGATDAYGTSFEPGNTLIIAESAELFQAENPESAAAATLVIDAAGVTRYRAVAETTRITQTGGASPTTFDLKAGATSSASTITYDDTAATVAGKLDDGVEIVMGYWGGPLGTAPVFVTGAANEFNVAYGSMPVTLVSDGGSSIAVDKVISNTGPGVVEPRNWFDLISVSEGMLTLQHPDTDLTYSTIKWGSFPYMPSAGNWENYPLTASIWPPSTAGVNPSGILAGHTMRFIYEPSPETTYTDYWESGRIHTPGYDVFFLTAEGTDNVSSGAGVMTDNTAAFPAMVGQLIFNLTDGSWGVISLNTATTVTAIMVSGTNNNWDSGDVYQIYPVVHSPEWLIVELDGMDLELQEDITDSAIDMIFGNTGGSTGSGLDSSGTIQLGTEQIAYSAIDRPTGVPTVSSRPAGSVAHQAGDPVYQVDTGTATNGYLVESVRFIRKAGEPLLEDFVIWTSPFHEVRNPDSTTNAVYLIDWAIGRAVKDAVSGATPGTHWVTEGDYEVFTWTPSSPRRIKWILILAGTMTGHATAPERAMLNEIEFTRSTSVLDTESILIDKQPTEVMQVLLTTAGVPTQALQVDVSGTDIEGFTTEAGMVWRIIADMAEFTGTRITLDRCSNITLEPDPWWSVSGTPAELGELVRSDLIYFEPSFPSGRQVGQVELRWRSPNNQETGLEKYPAIRSSQGDTVTAGPYVYADASAAQAGAQKRYIQARLPFDAIVEILDYGRDYRPGQVYGVNWKIDESMQAMNRTYLITNAEHRITNGTWVTGLTLLQLSRSDEK